MNEEEKKELEKSVDETVEEMKRKIEEITKAAEDVEDEGVSSKIFSIGAKAFLDRSTFMILLSGDSFFEKSSSRPSFSAG